MCSPSSGRYFRIGWNAWWVFYKHRWVTNTTFEDKNADLLHLLNVWPVLGKQSRFKCVHNNVSLLAHLSFSDHFLSVVCLFVCKLFTFSSSQELLYQSQTVQIIIGLREYDGAQLGSKFLYAKASWHSVDSNLFKSWTKGVVWGHSRKSKFHTIILHKSFLMNVYLTYESPCSKISKYSFKDFFLHISDFVTSP